VVQHGMGWERASWNPMSPCADLVEHEQIVGGSGGGLVMEAEWAKNIELAKVAGRNLLEKGL
jgi:hypothetical protein